MDLDLTLSTSAARSCGPAGDTTSTEDFASLSLTRRLRMSLARAASPAAMVKCLSAPMPRLERYPTPTITANTAGSPTVVARKARPRICSKYSRLAIRRILRIGLASHGLDKYLFERGLDQLKAVNGGYGSGLLQQLLGVSVLFEPNLGVAGVVLRFRNFFRIQESGASFKLDDHPVALVGGLDLA